MSKWGSTGDFGPADTTVADDGLGDAGEWRTYTQRAYDELRRRILDGRLPPGSRIIVRVLSEDLGLSPTPIKNALAALEREGLLDTGPYRGYSVPHTDPEAVAEAFEVLAVLDGLAARRIIAAGNRSTIDELRQLVRRQRQARADEPHSAGFELDFHKVMWEGAGNRQLVTAAGHQRGLLLVASGGLLELPERRPEIRTEHEAIVAALSAGDAVAAAAACERHMARSTEITLERIAERRGDR